LKYLLEAFSSLTDSNAVLVVVGAGSQREKLAQMVSDYGLNKRVRFLGYVSPEETIVCYAVAYIFVLPSITTPVFKEPWGLVVNEAFNQGVPIVATDAVGAAVGGLVKNGRNGFVVPEQDSQSLSKAIHTLLNDYALREQFSAHAYSEIQSWDNERMITGFRQAINLVVGS
jgi:glycosyltransferase involved in cell wall biosynthesis